jgi:hypothetical protein
MPEQAAAPSVRPIRRAAVPGSTTPIASATPVAWATMRAGGSPAEGKALTVRQIPFRAGIRETWPPRVVA